MGNDSSKPQRDRRSSRPQASQAPQAPANPGFRAIPDQYETYGIKA